MANRERGEASVTIEGATYVLRPTLNAVCDLEDLVGQSFAIVADRAAAGDIRAMRALIWSYLQDRHGDEIKTLADAGKWVERAGGLRAIEGAVKQISEANAAAPAAPGTPADPPVAQAALAGAPST